VKATEATVADQTKIDLSRFDDDPGSNRSFMKMAKIDTNKKLQEEDEHDDSFGELEGYNGFAQSSVVIEETK
jgi:hypothetical protein